MAVAVPERAVPDRLAAKPLVWRGIVGLLAAGLGAWGMMLVGASAGRLPERPKGADFAAKGWSPDVTEPAVPIPSAEPALDLSGPPDPLAPISLASARRPATPDASADLPGHGAPALLGPIGRAGESTQASPSRVQDAQSAISRLGAETSRLIRLASARLEAMRIQAWQAIRVAREAIAARAIMRTTPAEAGPKSAVARAREPHGITHLSSWLGLPEAVEADGTSKPASIEAPAGHITGPISVSFEGLPAGISLPSVTMLPQPNRTQAGVQSEAGACRLQARVRVTAPAGTELAEGTIDLTVPRQSQARLPRPGTILAGRRQAIRGHRRILRALAMASPDPIILNDRGLAYALLGQPDAAIADYTAALRLRPTDAVIRYNRGSAHALRGDTLRAELDFDAAIRLNPGYIPAYRSRAQLYARIGNPARAAADRARADQLEKTAGQKGSIAPPPPPRHPPAQPVPAVPSRPRVTAGKALETPVRRASADRPQASK